MSTNGFDLAAIRWRVQADKLVASPARPVGNLRVYQLGSVRRGLLVDFLPKELAEDVAQALADREALLLEVERLLEQESPVAQALGQHTVSIIENYGAAQVAHLQGPSIGTQKALNRAAHAVGREMVRLLRRRHRGREG